VKFTVRLNSNVFFFCFFFLSLAPPVEKLKLRDYASTRQKELTIERKQLWISRADTQQLCESDLKAQISDMLKNIDIRELATSKSISNIFESLGRPLLESEAEKLLFDLRSCGTIIMLFEVCSLYWYYY
jgi:hypothetical protein